VFRRRILESQGLGLKTLKTRGFSLGFLSNMTASTLMAGLIRGRANERSVEVTIITLGEMNVTNVQEPSSRYQENRVCCI